MWIFIWFKFKQVENQLYNNEWQNDEFIGILTEIQVEPFKPAGSKSP